MCCQVLYFYYSYYSQPSSSSNSFGMYTFKGNESTQRAFICIQVSFKFIGPIIKNWSINGSYIIRTVYQQMRGESRSTSKSPYKNNESKGDRPQSDPPCNKVYVTFLPEDIDEAKLRQVFSQCGNITRVFLKKKEDGFTFAHINYDTVDEARDAIEKLNKRRINNKNIKVQFGRQYVRGDSKDSRDGRDRNEKFGDRDRFNKGQQSDTRKRFDNQGGFESRGRGRGRGGREGERGGFREEFGRNDRGGERGDRGPMKCFKCQGQGHISKNCPNGQGGQQKRGAYGGESKQSKPFKPIDKMSEDECSDY